MGIDRMVAVLLVIVSISQARGGVLPTIDAEAKQGSVSYSPAPGFWKDPSDMDCTERNIYRANQNYNIPRTLKEMEEAVKAGTYRELSNFQSLFHNLKEDVKFDTVEQRLTAYVGAGIDYGMHVLKQLKEVAPNEISDLVHQVARPLFNLSPEEALEQIDSHVPTYLNTDFPNRKFVDVATGRMEGVYDRRTGTIVDRGPNQGTYNLASPDDARNHIGDIKDAIVCGVKVNETLKKQEEALEIIERAAKRTRDLFANEKVRQSEVKDCRGKAISMDDLKKMDFDDKNGDWCHCKNPQCIKRINRNSAGKLLSHCIGFECAKCRKINVEYAKLALATHQEALDQGLTPQWRGPNAEANARAAGNAE